MPPQMPQSPVDEVMHDFACNGYACDELNRYHLGMHLSHYTALTPHTGLNTSPFNSANTQKQNAAVVTSPSAADATTITLNQQQQLQQLRQKDLNNNFWKALPHHLKQQQQQNTQTVNAATDTATIPATTNIDYNSNQKKPKRYHSSKERYVSIFFFLTIIDTDVSCKGRS